MHTLPQEQPPLDSYTFYASRAPDRPTDHDSLCSIDCDHLHSAPVPQVPSFSLYAVHALCTFDERTYEFASFFFIMEIFKTTLLPMSIYGFSTTVAGILFSTTVGSLVDSTPRLPAVQSFLFTQKFTTVLGALGFWILLTWFDPSSASRISLLTPTSQEAIATKTEDSLSLFQGYCAFAFLVLASGVLKLSALGWSISIERDWIVALCQSDSDLLTNINVNMKRIDLVCKLVSPFIFANLLAQTNNAGYCSLAMAVWCMFSLLIELVLVRRIWFSSPILWQPRLVRSIQGRQEHPKMSSNPIKGKGQQTIGGSSSFRSHQKYLEEARGESYGERDLLVDRMVSQSETTWNQPSSSSLRSQPHSLLQRGIASFQAYTHHIVFLASLSYAIIYINMMSVSGTMIGYLQWRGFTAGSIALLKGVCTVSELLGTVMMPAMSRYVGLIRTGAWSIWLEVVTLTPVLLSIYSDRLPVQVVIFVGMALSRVGVWSFDLVITQIMQEYTHSTSQGDAGGYDNAGVINGWHYSMMNVFELAQFILTMIWSDPQSYFVPCTLSFGCIVLGAIVYSTYLIKMRGHLFHYQRIASAASAASSCLDTDNAEYDDEIGEQERDGQPGPSHHVHNNLE